MKNNMKKKGFTLIELIDVMAILAILGAVLVPKITGYMDKANKSSIQTSAKIIVSAIQAYNADATSPITTGTVDEAVTTVNASYASDSAPINISNANYTKLKDYSISDICNIAAGNFSYSASGISNINGSATITD